MLSRSAQQISQVHLRYQQLAHHRAAAVLVHPQTCSVTYGRARVAAEGNGPSTSHAAPLQLWRRQCLTKCRRSIALLASPASGGATHPQGRGAESDKVGIVIVDHGSRKKASNDMLVEFGELYSKVTGHEIVEIAHMEIAAPTIEGAIGRCAARGARKVVVAPYFLSRGRHIQEDIPALVRAAQQRNPGLQCVIADPIGIDVLLVQLISNRVAAALSLAGATGEWGEEVKGAEGLLGVAAAATVAEKA